MHEALPTIHVPSRELHDEALMRFEAAYREAQRRRRCSRQDFYDGYRAALIEVLRSRCIGASEWFKPHASENA